MPELAFDMTDANQASRRFEFRGPNKSEYYEGDLLALESGVDLRIEKTLAGEFSIYKLKSKSTIGFRRSWPHIRSDKTNVTVFWFVRQGQIRISGPTGQYDVHPGECMITRSAKPFYMELAADESGSMEVMHVVAPSHRVQAILSDMFEVGRPFVSSRGDLLLAERTFSLLFEEGDHIDQEIAEELIQTLLKAVSKTLSRESGVTLERCTIIDRRVADVTRYIRQHFANPDLNAQTVASACGISLRYLCHILKRNDLSFSSLVWDARIHAAHAWLADEQMQRYSISEIAYLVGFKSSAHFSRVFKARYGIVPSEFRTHAAAEAAAA